jgi:hypothetical protein
VGPRGVSRPAVWPALRPKTCRFRAKPEQRRARSSNQQNNSEDANDQAPRGEVQDRPRLGQNIWGRPKSPINKREYGPGQHGQRRKGKLSDYGVQLRAKQKLKGYYANMSERHFHGIYDEARRLKGDTGANMIGLLERRLDTMIYRAKFVPTCSPRASSSTTATSW